jgi:PKD repeat protein
MNRLALGTTLVAAVVVFSMIAGCESCEPPPPIPQPVPQEGKLPRAPEPAAPVGTPFIPDPSCVVVITSDVEEGAAPLTVPFVAEGMCTDAEGEYEWDFGDGSPRTKGANATHVYTKPGTYTASVKLVDPEHNAQDSDESTIVVAEP